MTVQRSPLDLSDIEYHLYTVFLFFKNDILTAIIPMTLFSIASAPLYSPAHIFPTILWIFLHLLQFDIANQIKGVEEDKANKPDRPIAAGRITVHDATILRWIMVPLCLAYSSLFSIQLVFSSLELQMLLYWYNEMNGDSHWLSKNAILALMYGCSGLGGTLVASRDASRVSESGKLAVQIITAVFSSTVHCQDFKDEGGDRLIGRCTVPIKFPLGSRLAAGLGIPMWSFLLCCIWDIDWFCTLTFFAYGCVVGARFWFLRTRDSDMLSCKYYSVWFSLQHLLPGYWNYFHDSNGVRSEELLQKTWDMFTGILSPWA